MPQSFAAPVNAPVVNVWEKPKGFLWPAETQRVGEVKRRNRQPRLARRSHTRQVVFVSLTHVDRGAWATQSIPLPPRGTLAVARCPALSPPTPNPQTILPHPAIRPAPSQVGARGLTPLGALGDYRYPLPRPHGPARRTRWPGTVAPPAAWHCCPVPPAAAPPPAAPPAAAPRGREFDPRPPTRRPAFAPDRPPQRSAASPAGEGGQSGRGGWVIRGGGRSPLPRSVAPPTRA